MHVKLASFFFSVARMTKQHHNIVGYPLRRWPGNRCSQLRANALDATPATRFTKKWYNESRTWGSACAHKSKRRGTERRFNRQRASMGMEKSLRSNRPRRRGKQQPLGLDMLKLIKPMTWRARLGVVLHLVRWDRSQPSACNNLVLVSANVLDEFERDPEAFKASMNPVARHRIEERLDSSRIDR